MYEREDEVLEYLLWGKSIPCLDQHPRRIFTKATSIAIPKLLFPKYAPDTTLTPPGA